ncbi:hypothetical protein [Haladaptatus salinisoli]|uniref:hypothetical protein n=1 Tax=Haladaptatus salinisoli TaxID=2884876 RepID=UPI001D0B5F9B|nr:hypothetical protein [Haladaptatus salinisoli]
MPKQTRRNWLKNFGTSIATCSLASFAVGTASALESTLLVDGQARSGTNIEYKIITTGNVDKVKSMCESEDYAADATNTIRGNIVGSGNDKFTFNGRIKSINAWPTNGGGGTIEFRMSRSRSSSGVGGIDIYGDGKYQAESAGSMARPGDGTLETDFSSLLVDEVRGGDLAIGSVSGGGHDHYEMTGDFNYVSFDVGNMTLERHFGRTW